MDFGERLINFVDRILDLFNAIKGYLENVFVSNLLMISLIVSS